MKFLLLLTFISTFSLADTASIMSYNVENLFDTVHDANKEDWEFLPKDAPLKKEACLKESSKKRRLECMKSDWTDHKLQLKLEQIVDVVKSAEGDLPDFLGLVEVENKNVVSMLANKLGYKNFEITDSPDNRGVDVALMFKESKKIVKVSRNELIVPTDYPTRNILEVRFQLAQNSFLTLFVNHWPSLHNPDSARVKAAEVLRKRVEEILKLNPEEKIVAMGDFNTVDSNNPHPFKTVLYKDNLFSDVYESVISDKKIPDTHKKNLSTGTYYFAPQDEWNMLDHFFVNQNILKDKNIEETLTSFLIFSTNNMRKEIKKEINSDKEKGLKIVLAPKRFDPEANTKDGIGYSDHFPIMMKISFEEKKVEPIKGMKKKAKKI